MKNGASVGALNSLGGNGMRMLMNHGAAIESIRPWFDLDGNAFIDNYSDPEGEPLPINNATTTLLKDEWKLLDKKVVMESTSRLVAVNDLISRGLVYDVPNALGVTILEHETSSDMNDAEISMDGRTRGNNDRAVFELEGLPLPLTHKEFEISMRHLLASRRGGLPLDTFQAGVSTRKVVERIEKSLFLGLPNLKYGGYKVYGFTTHPDRNTYTLGGDWSASAMTGALILADVLGMIRMAEADGFYGPFVLYIPTDYSTKLEDDFKANSDLTIRARLLLIDSLKSIIVEDQLTDNNVCLSQATEDVVRMVRGFMPTPVDWMSNDGMVAHMKVISILVPQIRSTQGNKCGVVHGATA